MSQASLSVRVVANEKIKSFALPRLKGWRQDKGITQSVLAEQTGLSASYLSRLESGKRDASLGTLALMSAAGVPVAELGAFDSEVGR